MDPNDKNTPSRTQSTTDNQEKRKEITSSEPSSIFSGLGKKITKIFGFSKPESNLDDRVVGWVMTPSETKTFFDSLGKQVVTLIGYSMDYENSEAMLQKVETVLSDYDPDRTIINIGGTKGGIGAAYPIAKARGFTTTAIVSTCAVEWLDDISPSVDHICFVEDSQWGGKLPDSNQLSPTSQAMVSCSHIIIGIGGGMISRDEMLAGRDLGKPVYFYPAERNHQYMIRRAQKRNLDPPKSFWGEAHEAFASDET
jgi:hypothetical protein